MRLLRRQREIGLLALLALALQLCVSFAHVHPIRVALVASDPRLACRTFFQPASDQTCPPLKRTDDQCSICWTVALTGSSLVPEPPALPLPAPVDGREIPIAAWALDPGLRTHAFEARGPPSLV